MVLDKETVRMIEEFVFSRPRTVQEIAQLTGRSWRTAENYIRRISKENGTLEMHTFRGGTRGALKLVYWRNIEQPHTGALKERLFRQIQLGRSKLDFSPFDIYQFVEKGKKEAYLEEQEDEAKEVKQDLLTPLRSAREQVLIFSGNLSWANIMQDGVKMLDVFEELAERGVSIRFLARVDISAMKNYEMIAAVNERTGSEMVEIRHAEQPLRAFIIDDRMVQLKEVKEPECARKGELRRRTYIFYRITDPEWVRWMQKVFYNLFRTALPAEKRIENLRMIEGLQLL